MAFCCINTAFYEQKSTLSVKVGGYAVSTNPNPSILPSLSLLFCAHNWCLLSLCLRIVKNHSCCPFAVPVYQIAANWKNSSTLTEFAHTQYETLLSHAPLWKNDDNPSLPQEGYHPDHIYSRPGPWSVKQSEKDSLCATNSDAAGTVSSFICLIYNSHLCMYALEVSVDTLNILSYLSAKHTLFSGEPPD